MPNGRSGGCAVNTQRFIAALQQLNAQDLVGPHYGDRDFGEPITVAVMLAAAEYTAQPSLVVEEQYGAWFIVRLPDFWVTVKEDSPLFEGLVQAIKQTNGEREAPPEVLERPIENCYWVASKKLLAGEYPGALNRAAAIEKIKALTDAGVAAFIDLTEERDGLEPYADLVKPASYQRFGIRDVSTPESPEVTLAILDAIDEHIAAGRLVYVHCWGGVGRTGVIVGCWLSRHGMEDEAAVQRLAELWKQCPKSASRKSPETSKQQRYIKDWMEPSPRMKRSR
jgi:hypothetical protein